MSNESKINVVDVSEEKQRALGRLGNSILSQLRESCTPSEAMFVTSLVFVGICKSCDTNEAQFNVAVETLRKIYQKAGR